MAARNLTTAQANGQSIAEGSAKGLRARVASCKAGAVADWEKLGLRRHDHAVIAGSR